MTLIPCPECRRAVSSAAFQCPGCGQPLHGDARPPRGRDRVLPLVIGGALLASVLGSAGIWMAASRYHDGRGGDRVEVIRTVEFTHAIGVPAPPPPPLPRLTVIEEPMPPIPGRLDALPEMLNGVEVSRLVARLYPRALRDAGIPGIAVVRFRVLEDGRPDLSSLSVEHASHDEFADAAPPIVARMRFHPSMVDGEPVDAWLTVPISFDPTR